MPTLEDLRPSRSWDDLLADVRRRGTALQRRRRFARSVATVIGALLAVVLPLSAALFDTSASPDVPPVPLDELDPVLPPRPIIALPGAPAPRLSPTAPSGPSIALGAPPKAKPPLLSEVLVHLFTDAAGDVKKGAGLSASEPAIDLRRGNLAYEADAMTFSIVVSDLSVERQSDLCHTYRESLAYRGLELTLSATRGDPACSQGFSFTVNEGIETIGHVTVVGRFDEATNSILATISLAELNRALPQTTSGGTEIPRVTASSRYDAVSAESIVWKRIGSTATLSDPRNASDQASG